MDKKTVSDPVKFKAEKVKVYGPKVDGGFTVTLDVGEYEAQTLAQLFGLKQGTIKEIEIKDGMESEPNW